MIAGEARHNKKPVAGFALMAALVTIAIAAAGSLAALRYSAAQQQREKEAWLLFVGNEYRVALERYAAAGQGTPAHGPRELEDLLVDRRGSTPLHHLRRLYPDPMTGRADWVLLRDASGGISALHSNSSQAPMRRTGFAAHEKDFERAKTYRGWVFSPAADAGKALGQNALDNNTDSDPESSPSQEGPP